jgi:hypothetical protein
LHEWNRAQAFLFRVVGIWTCRTIMGASLSPENNVSKGLVVEARDVTQDILDLCSKKHKVCGESGLMMAERVWRSLHAGTVFRRDAVGNRKIAVLE